MLKLKYLTGAILALLLLLPGDAPAADGQAQVYKKDSQLTPAVERVLLQDLDGSGYLCNPYLSLLVKKGSRYDYPAYSLTGQFLYNPTTWNYNNISAEGIKFDVASTYYYLTVARRYFQDHFGFKQSFDGSTIDKILVYLFFDDLINGVYADSPRTISLSPPSIIFTVPGDPHIQWAPNYNREFSVVMHEYSHLIFTRYSKRMMLQATINSEADAINEGLAIFWPCAIMDEPRYGRTVWYPGVQQPDLSVPAVYDSTIQDPALKKANMISALTTALWGLRDHPRIGKTNGEMMIYQGMALIPNMGAQLADVTNACIKAKAYLNPTVIPYLKDEYISDVLAKHNIGLKNGSGTYYMIFTEKQDNIPEIMKPNEIRSVTVTFVNNSPSTVNSPKLIAFNPLVNPNVDKPQVKTNYNWNAPTIIYPTIQTRVAPKGEVSFTFYITAPPTLGVYSCDWVIQLDGYNGYIVSKDIVVDEGLSVKILAPQSNEFVKGQLQISGSALAGQGFQRYELSYARAENPANKTLITSSNVQIQNGILGVWDTTRCQNGRYVLTLKGVSNLSTYETSVMVNIGDPLYSFFDKNTESNFYTTNEAEKKNIIDCYSNIFLYQGIACGVSTIQRNGTVAFHRLYNKTNGEHFYTASESEKNWLISNYSNIFQYEGIACYVYPASAPISGSVSLYRFWNKLKSCHFYTTSEAEKANIIKNYTNVYSYEGIACFVYPAN